MTDMNNLLSRAQALKLYGLVAHWNEIENADLIERWISWEEKERSRRGLEHRLLSAHIEKFKPLSEFDWNWPKKCDRQIIEELMQLDFLTKATNIILCGPNGAGKSTIARNIAYQTVLHGQTALFITAGKMLNDLASQDGDNALRRRIKHYVQPTLLCCDEVGYLSYSNRHADLFFEIVSRRYEKKSTLITTNKPFAEWGEIFPNASCVVSLIDRLIHNSEILNIDAASFRLKEANENSVKRGEERAKRNKKSSLEKSKISEAT